MAFLKFRPKYHHQLAVSVNKSKWFLSPLSCASCWTHAWANPIKANMTISTFHSVTFVSQTGWARAKPSSLSLVSSHCITCQHWASSMKVLESHPWNNLTTSFSAVIFCILTIFIRLLIQNLSFYLVNWKHLFFFLNLASHSILDKTNQLV